MAIDDVGNVSFDVESHPYTTDAGTPPFESMES